MFLPIRIGCNTYRRQFSSNLFSRPILRLDSCISAMVALSLIQAYRTLSSISYSVRSPDIACSSTLGLLKADSSMSSKNYPPPSQSRETTCLRGKNFVLEVQNSKSYTILHQHHGRTPNPFKVSNSTGCKIHHVGTMPLKSCSRWSEL